MIRCLSLLSLLTLSASADAVVIRHDIDDTQYRVPASEFPALVDMPGEGHGVLVAPEWFITAAHTIRMPSALKQVEIDGKTRHVERIVVHPGYKALPQVLVDQAMASGEATLIVAFLAQSDDLALVKLADPVTDVTPAALYRREVRPGQVVKLIGKGATGNGATGYRGGGPNRTELRRAYNKITSAYDRWFCYRFDEPVNALPLEGTIGNGDSGGPVLVETEDHWSLSGLVSWKVVQGNVVTAQYGRYGEIACNVRLSDYLEWIDGVMSGRLQARDADASKLALPGGAM